MKGQFVLYPTECLLSVECHVEGWWQTNQTTDVVCTIITFPPVTLLVSAW